LWGLLRFHHQLLPHEQHLKIYTTKLLTKLYTYSRVGILLTCKKHLHDYCKPGNICMCWFHVLWSRNFFFTTIGFQRRSHLHINMYRQFATTWLKS
jgi:hypothetical protein